MLVFSDPNFEPSQPDSLRPCHDLDYLVKQAACYFNALYTIVRIPFMS